MHPSVWWWPPTTAGCRNPPSTSTRVSVNGGSPRAGGASFLLDQGGKSTHFNYFANERTAQAVVAGLTQALPAGVQVDRPSLEALVAASPEQVGELSREYADRELGAKAAAVLTGNFAALDAIEAEVRKDDDALIRQMLEHLEVVTDVGPDGEGWQSQDLKNTIAAAYNITYTGWPGLNVLAISFNQRMESPALNQLAIVAGNKIIDDAKMGGITPAIFSFSGR